MDRITDYGSPWVLKNWEFHQTLYGAGSSKTMIDLVERIHLKIERYARQAGTDARLREAAAEHREYPSITSSARITPQPAPGSSGTCSIPARKSGAISKTAGAT